MAEILSDKRVVLSNPGSKRNDVYYTTLNTTVEQVESTYSMGRFKQSITNQKFGGQALITIPNSTFLGEMYLHLELPALVANQTICRGWGYGCIDNISYLFGSSNVSQIQINGQSILQTVMAQCETAEKRNELFRLAGEELGTLTTDVGISPKADLILPLPWSTLCGGMFKKKPFDTNLLDAPITVTIAFKNAESIYGGSGARPDGFSVATALFRQGELANKANSLRNVLMSQPDLMLAYPFIHHQSFAPARFTVSDPTQTQNVILQSFINADIVGITIGVIRKSRLNPGSNNSPSPFAYDDISDVRLLFNGQVMYEAPGNLMKLVNMNSIEGAGYFHNSVLAAGTTAPFTSDAVDSYILMIDFARIRSMCFEGEYQNVMRIGNQVLELEFKVQSADDYNLYATYHYNGVAEIQRGQSNIFFN